MNQIFPILKGLVGIKSCFAEKSFIEVIEC